MVQHLRKHLTSIKQLFKPQAQRTFLPKRSHSEGALKIVQYSMEKNAFRVGMSLLYALYCFALPIQASSTDSLPATADIRLVEIIGVGDMMLGTNYPSKAYLPPNDGRELLAEVVPILAKADITFGNLEGCLLNSGGTAKRCKDPSKCYAFRSPENYVHHFVKAGFDFLSLANNHSGDFGPLGRKRTKEVLRENGIAFAGLAGTDEYAVIEKDSLRYGFAAFAPNSGTCDLRKLEQVKRIISQLEKQCDIVIVSFHGGAEGAKHQNIPHKTEYYYGENRGNVVAFAHAAIDAGADVVFGHGPHVTRAVELYKDRFIAYSLGNFCTYGRFNLRGEAGIAPLMKVYTDERGRFIRAEIVPIYQTKTTGPRIDPQKRAIQSIRRLTAADFPLTPLEITEEGVIVKKE